ncbi:hypothetical protein [Herminiimonas fonticola]|uniref:Uncharacterized protein n=1 Tax=Herminiimonas fonticola TaxID=303380 RepID=A0A4R6G7T6_9BURK|nr:hypothetical protein [Herminiimonas fonticola]RBA23833.1 hypothetical protein Hfont_1645 [Herminiimonas fonticola]TDN89835.1 hypothetical protein EV677_1899 [Herminiimonas fonticola]
MTSNKGKIMDNLNVQFHVSVLTVPSFVTADQFSEWLHREALAIQELSEDNSLTIVRLFLAARIKEALGRKKLDVLLQAITDKYPHIFRVEMVVIDNQLNIDEKELIQSDAENELAQILETVKQLQELQIAKSKLH